MTLPVFLLLRKDSYGNVRDYMKHFTEIHGINKFFPIFSEADTSYDGGEFKSTVVSTDSTSEFYYRVVFHENPPTALDRRRSHLNFEI